MKTGANRTRIMAMASILAHAASAMRSFSVPVVRQFRDSEGSIFSRNVQVKVFNRRLKPALRGGNWQGQPYLTYAEHDRITRNCLVAREAIPGLRSYQLKQVYSAEKAAFLMHRKEKHGV